ncbi:hypothetical protein JW865_00585 [Candidatus Bathyarchaeota archaeon]|nr:hypothetical protein [Candidatus Bathyarchaeota archaeon]
MVHLAGDVMTCSHDYAMNWEFGPILQKNDEEKPHWWFYRKCSKCGSIELFPSWKLNLKPRTAIDDRDLYMIKAE